MICVIIILLTWWKDDCFNDQLQASLQPDLQIDVQFYVN